MVPAVTAGTTAKHTRDPLHCTLHARMTTGRAGQAPRNTFPAKASRGDCGSVSVGAEVTGWGGLGWAGLQAGV